MKWLLPLAFGCSTSSEPDSTPPAEANPALSAEDLEDLPVLTVEFPERGAFDSAGSGAVRGRVEARKTKVETLTINGEAFDVEGTGRFEAQSGWTPGIQILSTRVETENGERAVDGRAFHAGPVHDPGAWIPGAIRMEIDGEVLDDNDADPDDIAGLLELELEDRSLLEGFVGVPIDVGGAVITPDTLAYGRAHIDVAPGDGFLDGVVSLDGMASDFELAGVDWYSWLSTSGSAWATSADIGIKMTVDSAGGRVRCEATEIDIVINGFGVSVDVVPDFLEGSIAGLVEDFIVEAVEDVVVEEVIPRAEEVLSGFAIGTTFDDANLEMEMRLAEVEVAESGVRFEVDARVEATNGITLPPNAGSLDTAGVATPWPDQKDQPFWAAIDDDLLNQLSFAFWHSGVTKDIELDAILLGAMTGGPLPPPLGPADTVTMTLNLPPVMTPTEQDDWAAQLAIGEWNIAFNRTDGEVLEFSVNARAHVQASVDDGGEIAVSVDSRPAQLEQAVGVLRAPEALDPGDLSALIRLLIPPLLSNTANFAPDVPIPEIPLDEFLSVPATEGKKVRMADPSVRLEENGWMLLEAGVEVY